MPQCYLDAVRQIDQTVNPLFCFLKARLTLADHGKASIVMPVGPHLRQGGGNVAGGILATMADEAMAHVVMANLKAGAKTATIEMNMRYLRSAREGTLFAVGRIARQGRTIITTESEVLDQDNNLLALAGASFIVL